MDTNYLENNYLTLVGKVTGEKRFSHEIYGERFFTFNLSIPRLSGNADIIPVTTSERLITDEMLTEGNKLLIKGQFRSYNSYENERNKLVLIGENNYKDAMLIGFVMLLHDSILHYSHLSVIGVLEEYRRNGIGTKLSKFVLSKYPNEKYHYQVSHTNKASIGLVTSLGFKFAGARELIIKG